MEDFSSLWSYQDQKWQSIDELKNKFLYTDLELETTRIEANEERRKHEENMKHLLDLLKLAYQERDEAKAQLQQLLEKFTPSSISESNSTFSDAFNNNYNNYHESSPIDFLFDVVSSPKQPCLINLETQDCGDHDKASIVISNLAKNKVLPKQGKLLEAVMDAGPLLQTLLVAGPLPRWRNPPPLQSFKIPHVSDNVMIQSHLNNTLSPYVEMNCGSLDQFSNFTPMFNFSGGPGFSSEQQFSLGIGKRPRLH